jgi:NADH-quinone oxidoreductase subunit J
MTLTTAQVVFYYMAGASVASALLAVTRKNPVHSMLWLLALFLHVAGIFLWLGAEFLAAVQVIVYAGAILVFYLFVVMLLDLPGEEARPRFSAHWPLAAVAAFSFGALTWLAQYHALDDSPVGAGRSMGSRGMEGPTLGSVADVGLALFGPFMLPFELASLLLLAAIVGAVVLARRRPET